MEKITYANVQEFTAAMNSISHSDLIEDSWPENFLSKIYPICKNYSKKFLKLAHEQNSEEKKRNALIFLSNICGLTFIWDLKQAYWPEFKGNASGIFKIESIPANLLKTLEKLVNPFNSKKSLNNSEMKGRVSDIVWTITNNDKYLWAAVKSYLEASLKILIFQNDKPLTRLSDANIRIQRGLYLLTEAKDSGYQVRTMYSVFSFLEKLGYDNKLQELQNKETAYFLISIFKLLFDFKLPHRSLYSAILATYLPFLKDKKQYRTKEEFSKIINSFDRLKDAHYQKIEKNLHLLIQMLDNKQIFYKLNPTELTDGLLQIVNADFSLSEYHFKVLEINGKKQSKQLFFNQILKARDKLVPKIIFITDKELNEKKREIIWKYSFSQLYFTSSNSEGKPEEFELKDAEVFINKLNEKLTHKQIDISRHVISKANTTYFGYLKDQIENLISKHRHTFIHSRTISSVNYDQKSQKFKNVNNSEMLSVSEIIILKENFHIALIGEMGVGKSVFCIHLLNKYIENKKIPAFIELSKLKELPEASTINYENYMYLLAEFTLVTLISLLKTKFKNQLIREKETFISYLISNFQNSPSTFILDSFDELIDNHSSIVKIVEFAIESGHKIIIAGRDYTFVQHVFHSKVKAYFSPYKLNNFTDSQVEEFARQVNTEWSSLDTSKLQSISPSHKKNSEFSYRNPLILQTILPRLKSQDNKYSKFNILKDIAEDTFAWYTGKKLNIPEYHFNMLSLAHLNFQNLRKEFFTIHKNLAMQALKNKKAINTKYITVEIDRLNSTNLSSKKILLDYLKKDWNSGFLVNSFGAIQMLPDKILDFFIVDLILENLRLNTSEKLISYLAQNTFVFRSTIHLLLEKIDESDEKEKCQFQKAGLLINKKASQKKLYKELNLQWYYKQIDTKNGYIEKLNLNRKNQDVLSGSQKKSILDNWKLNPVRHVQQISMMTSAFSNLKVLDLSGIGLVSLPKGLVYLSKLQELYLSKNRLNSISLKFNQLSNLHTLDLRENLLIDFPKDLTQLFKLKKLDLSGNMLITVPDSISSNFKLKVLYLQNNNIKKNSDEIGNLSELQELNLSDNGMLAIPDNFQLLSELKELILKNNKIKSIPKSFAQLKKIETLNLENNLFKRLPQIILKAPSLKKLLLGGNYLKEVPECITFLQELHSLILKKNNLTEVHDSLGSLSKLRELNLSENNLSSIPKTIEQLNKLRWLNLKNNQLTTILINFAKLSELLELNISENKLSRFPENVVNSPKLRSLFLSENKIKTLPTNFAKLKKLRVLNLDRNLITSLPDNVDALNDLRDLNLSQNSFSVFPENLAKLRKLRTLYLNRNKLTELAKDFSKYSELSNFSVRENSLKFLPNNISELKSLIELNLDGNQITYLPMSIGKLSKLRKLNLWGNKLQFLPDSIGQLSMLEKLYLGGNNLMTLPDSLALLSSLKKLALSENKFTRVPKVVLELSNLRYLYLDGNRLNNLCGNISNLSMLRELSLSNNELTSIPPNIRALVKLKELDLRVNKLTFLPKGVHKLSELDILRLDENMIAELSDEFLFPANLTRLNLKINKLSLIPKNLAKLLKLISLDLSGNELTECPDSLGSFFKLQYLNLSGNLLASLPESIGKLSKLQILDLSSNLLTFLPEKLCDLAELQELNLGDTALTSLPENIGKLSKLKKLHLNNTKLVQFPESLSKLTKLQLLNFNGTDIFSIRNNEKLLSWAHKLGTSGCDVQYDKGEKN